MGHHWNAIQADKAARVGKTVVRIAERSHEPLIDPKFVHGDGCTRWLPDHLKHDEWARVLALREEIKRNAEFKPSFRTNQQLRTDNRTAQARYSAINDLFKKND